MFSAPFSPLAMGSHFDCRQTRGWKGEESNKRGMKRMCEKYVVTEMLLILISLFKQKHPWNIWVGDFSADEKNELSAWQFAQRAESVWKESGWQCKYDSFLVSHHNHDTLMSITLKVQLNCLNNNSPLGWTRIFFFCRNISIYLCACLQYTVAFCQGNPQFGEQQNSTTGHLHLTNLPQLFLMATSGFGLFVLYHSQLMNLRNIKPEQWL